MKEVETLKDYVREIITEYPELKGTIIELYELCLFEVQDGASEENELELFYSEVESLIKNK